MIQYAEIMLYDENDNTAGFSLSPTQLKAVCKVLGLKPGNEPGTITCYSDKTVEQFFHIKANPLTLEEK